MNQLQKKCVVGSVGVHSLLALLLLIGPAFVASKTSPVEEVQILTFIPLETTDLKVQGGGSPEVKSAPPAPAPPEPKPPAPAPPAPPEPTPPPEPVKHADPPKVKAEPKPVETKPQLEDSFEVSKSKKPKLSEADLKPVVHKHDAKTDAKARAEAQAREDAREAREAAKAAQARRDRIARAFGDAASSLVSGNGLSGGTSVELQGPGGGGVPYANFLDAVLSAYDRAWVVPDGVTDEEATAQATVVVARDGTIVSARINRPSGNAAVDRSVRQALDRVKKVPPLPKTAKEDERTVKVNFNVKAKRLLG